MSTKRPVSPSECTHESNVSAAKKICCPIESVEDGEMSDGEFNEEVAASDDKIFGGAGRDVEDRGEDMSEQGDESEEETEEVEDDELYSWLEEGVEEGSNEGGEVQKEAPPVSGNRDGQVGEDGRTEREKIILDELVRDPFDVLPEGWVIVSHSSGMPVYLHRASRVCTMAKPYFLGSGSARKHDIPISAIPCLQYRRALENEATPSQVNGDEGSLPETATPNDVHTVPASHNPAPEMSWLKGKVRITCADETTRLASLGPEDLRQYCSAVFRFKTIKVVRFNSWKNRRAYDSKKKLNRPSMPDDTKLITCSVVKDTPGGKTTKQFVLNPCGKSIVCILHEYCQQALKLQPTYRYVELLNSLKPYSATVVIGESCYATGHATSKRAAKAEAARLTVNILIPEMNDMVDEKGLADVSFFDDVRIEDPRALDLCNKTSQPIPYQLLLECLRRNYGIQDNQIHVNYKMIKGQKHEFTMNVGKHEAQVLCRNKREGKQLAAQSILQKLHPHLTNLGSVLKMYGRASMDLTKEMKQEELAITELQQHKKVNKPNTAVLTKLKEEMMKLKQEMAGVTTNSTISVRAEALHKSQIFNTSMSLSSADK